MPEGISLRSTKSHIEECQKTGILPDELVCHKLLLVVNFVCLVNIGAKTLLASDQRAEYVADTYPALFCMKGESSSMTENKNDFTQGSIVSKLLRFMLPILGALILQAMYGAVSWSQAMRQSLRVQRSI